MIEVDTDPQDLDAVLPWRRISMKYADGCEILLDGQNKEKGAPFIAGPKGKLFKDFESDIPDLQAKLKDAARSRAAAHGLHQGGQDAAEVRAERDQRPPLVHARQPGEDRRADGQLLAV